MVEIVIAAVAGMVIGTSVVWYYYTSYVIPEYESLMNGWAKAWSECFQSLCEVMNHNLVLTEKMHVLKALGGSPSEDAKTKPSTKTN